MDNLLKLVYAAGKHVKEELTLRDLAKKAEVPYTTAHRIILKNKELFNAKQKANIKLCSLKLENKLVKNYLIIAENKQAESFMQKSPVFSIIKKELPKGEYSVVLFGSRAEGKAREKSDMDLCIISKDGKKNVNFSKHELLFKIEINPMFFSENEFIMMLKDKEHNVAKEIIGNHVILYGEEYFWRVVWNGI